MRNQRIDKETQDKRKRDDNGTDFPQRIGMLDKAYRLDEKRILLVEMS